jgi:hypothetical protein
MPSMRGERYPDGRTGVDGKMIGKVMPPLKPTAPRK